MANVKGIEHLVAARKLLKTSLEKSRAFASALDEMGPRLDTMNQRLPYLEAAARSISVRKSTFTASKDHIDDALGSAAAVLRVFDTARELEKLLLSDSCSDLFNYLLLMKRFEEVLRFLADNCGLAIKWLEGIIEQVEDDTLTMTNDRSLSRVKKSLRILRELKADEEHDNYDGGLLSAAFEKLEFEFKRLLIEQSVPSDLASLATSTDEQAPNIASLSLPEPVIQKLQAIVERLDSSDQLKNCVSIYINVRSANAKQSLQALGLNYLEMSITKHDDVQGIEGYVDQWRKHLVLAVKYVLELEYRLCDDVFKTIGFGVSKRCFAKIATQSGILALLQFGKHVTECKKDPIKLLKLLDMFASLNDLRLDFNRLFSGEDSAQIRNLTRDLIKSIVDGACEIFWRLPLHVEMQKRSSPPSDGSVPSLVSFMTYYCNQLLGDEYRPMLTQVLEIHHSWKQESYEEGIILDHVVGIMKEIGVILDGWSKAYEDISLSYFFMMNNHCHLGNMKGTKIGDMMGDSWLTGHEQYKDYYAALYLRKSWEKLLTLLSRKGLTGSLAGADLVKNRMKAFNEAFDERYKKQCNWIISDENLREKVCQLLVQAVLPVYTCYIQKEDATASKYVKYSPQNLEKMLNSLFQPKLMKYGGIKEGHLLGNVENPAWSLDNTRTSLLPQKLRSYGSSRQAHLRGKLKSFVTNQFRLSLSAILHYALVK